MELITKIPKRVEWIDIFKGIAIFLMVIGHAASPLNGYIYLFHMGAFLFISGYTSKLNKVPFDILFIKKFLGLLLPYYVISIISIFILCLLNYLGIYDNLFSNNYVDIKLAINLLFDGYNVSSFLGATWFLIVLFNVFIVQKLLLLCSRNKVKYLYFILSLGLFLVGYYFVRIKVSSPRLMIDLVFIAQFYFALGVISNEFSYIIKKIKNKKTVYLIATLISIGLLYYFKNINYSGVDYPSREFGNILNNFLATISGIIILTLISNLLVNTKRLKKQLILMGKNTLGILFFHFLYFKLFFIILALIFNLDKEIWFLKQIPDNNNMYWVIISLFSIYLSIFTWKYIRKSRLISIFLGANQDFYKRIINNFQILRNKLSIPKRRRFELLKKETYLRVFNIVFLFSFIYILFEVLFNKYSIYWTEQHTKFVLLGILLGLYLIVCLSKIFKNFSNNIIYLIIGCCMLVILGLQILFAMNFKVNPTWDFGIIYNEAVSMGQGNPISSYFYDYYPNNIGSLMLYNMVFKMCNLFGFTNYLNVLIVINIFFIDIAIVSLLFLVKKLYTLRAVALLSVIMIFITPIYCYVTIVYTDTLAMMFPILSFILYYYASNSKKLGCKKKIFYILCIGILLTIGSIIKMNVIITLVAMLIHSFFTQKNNRFFIFTITIVLCFVCLNKVYSNQVERIIPIPYEEAGLPSTHWIMMGLKDNGRYNLDEANFSISLRDEGYTKDEIMEQNLSVIQSRIKNYGFSGIIKHIREKIDFTWGDGTYYSIDKLRREPLDSNVFQSYIFGEKIGFFVMINQIIHMIVLIGVILSAVSNLYKLNFINILANITIFGVMLFLLIWETRSRYLVLYIPILLVSMTHGYYFLCNLVSRDEDKGFLNE